MRKSAATALRLHKWLGLLVGIQVLLWLASGLYMVVVDLDFIHGDPLVRNMEQPLETSHARGVTFAQLGADYPAATAITLKPLIGRHAYAVTTTQARHLVDATSGRVISPLDETATREIAIHHYNGDAPIAAATLITADAPLEIRGRSLPLWRVDFDDRLATSFYIDPMDGTLVTRRHDYWRVFDVAWMLHIMDYRERDDIHHPLLWAAQVLGLLLFLTGAWVLVYRLTPRPRRRKGNRTG